MHVQEGTQILAITSMVNGVLRCIPSTGGKGHMYLPGMVTGVLQLVIFDRRNFRTSIHAVHVQGMGIYGYFGAEQRDARKASDSAAYPQFVPCLHRCCG